MVTLLECDEEGGESENLARREHEAQLKKDKGELDKVVREQPHLAAIALRHLHNLGLDLTPGGAQPVAAKPSRQASGALKRKKTLMEKELAVDTPSPPSTAWSTEDKIPTCYVTLGEMSMKLLASLLTRLNPVSFSAANLRAKQGSRAATKEVYLRLIEFVTGLDGQTALGGNLRWWPGLYQALEDGVARLGERATHCLIQPDWTTAGVFRLEASSDPDYVKFFHVNGTSSELPLRWLGGKESTHYNLVIHYNWSDVKAKIFDRCGTPRGWCSQLLPSFSEPSPQRKKKRCQR